MTGAADAGGTGADEPIRFDARRAASPAAAHISDPAAGIGEAFADVRSAVVTLCPRPRPWALGRSALDALGPVGAALGGWLDAVGPFAYLFHDNTERARNADDRVAAAGAALAIEIVLGDGDYGVSEDQRDVAGQLLNWLQHSTDGWSLLGGFRVRVDWERTGGLFANAFIRDVVVLGNALPEVPLALTVHNATFEMKAAI